MNNKKWAIPALLAAAAVVPTATQKAPDVFDILSFRNIDPTKLPHFDVNHDGKFDAHDFIVPDSVAFIKKPKDLFDSKLISENLGYPVFILDSKFSEEIFGTKEKPNEELRAIGKKSSGGMLASDQDTSKLVMALREALEKTFPGQGSRLDNVAAYPLYLQAGYSYDILMRAEDHPVDIAVGRAAPMRDQHESLRACFITATSPDTITWERRASTLFRYAGQPVSIPYDIKVDLYETMAHEIGHCAQFKNRSSAIKLFFVPADIDERLSTLAEIAQSFEYKSNVSHIIELDAKIIGQQTIQNMISDPVQSHAYQEYSAALSQTTTLHVLLQAVATADPSALYRISGYNYHLSAALFEKSGQIYDPKQLRQTRISLTEKILDPYQLYTPEKQKAFVTYGFPTYRDISTRLKRLVAEKSLTHREQQMALSEIKAFDTIGIIPADNQDHLKGWQKFLDNEKAAKATPAAPSF